MRPFSTRTDSRIEIGKIVKENSRMRLDNIFLMARMEQVKVDMKKIQVVKEEYEKKNAKKGARFGKTGCKVNERK